MSNVVNYVPQVDYTSRDYVSLLNDMLALAKQLNPEWTSSDPADMGVTLIELFAYLGDILNFYIDRMANEGFLATASQRESLLQIAALLGYTPATTSAASATLLFSNVTGNTVTIPAKTKVASASVVNGLVNQIVFETNSQVVVPAGTNAAPGQIQVTATQGITVGAVGAEEVLGYSTGSSNQAFKLAEQPVIIDSIQVFVNDVPYTYSPSLIDNTVFDAVFTTATNSEGYTYVIFGDGIGGKVPLASQSIKAIYRVGKGASGNVPAYTLEKFIDSSFVGVTVTNPEDAYGGSDEESNDSIRINAPRVFKALNRAVSLKDYAYLTLQVPGVSKAAADASVTNSVNIYTAPFGSTGFVYETASITGVAITATGGGAGTGGITYTATNTNFAVGDYVTITGMVPNSYNVVDAVITARAGTSFTIASSATGTFSSGGTAVVATGLSTFFVDLQTKILSFFSDKTAPNVTLNIQAGIYSKINVDLLVNVMPQYKQETVTSQINAELANMFSLDNSFFAEKVTSDQISSVLRSLPGVQSCEVVGLRKAKNEKIFSVNTWERSASNVVKLVLYRNAPGSVDFSVNANSLISSKIQVFDVNPTINTSNLNTVVVTAAGSDFISFSNTGATQTATSTGIGAGNYVRVLTVESISCDVNEVPTLGTVQIVPSGGIV
jgi:hypothetical protein